MKIVGKRFYLRDPDKVAKSLLGKILVRKIGNKVLSGKIVETEAYFGEDDPASRAYKRKYKKFYEMMKGEVGRSFIYVVHANCLFNIVAHKKNEVGAILIRAIEPLEGIDVMIKNRNVQNILNLTNGPGKLTKALNITLNDNRIDLTSQKSKIFVIENRERFKILTSKRIGVSRDLEKELRFFIEGNRFVSKRK